MRNLAWLSFVAAAVAFPAYAHAAPGDLLVAEPGSGTVLEFSAGGDLSSAARFATGLDQPFGLCVGPGGDIYVAEGGSGQITVITDGGDFTDATAFAFGPFFASGLWCDSQTVLVTDATTGLVADITTGGDVVANATLTATSLPAPVDLLVDDMGTILSANGDLFDITAGGDFAMAMPFATGRPTFTVEWFGGQALGGVGDAPEVVDYTGGGDLSAAPPFATLPAVGLGRVEGLLSTSTGTLYAVTGEEIYDVTAGGDLTGASPFATGLTTGEVGFAGMIEHVCAQDAECDDGDACNGAEVCADNACQGPQDPFSCDDGDVCTADACDAQSGCSNAPIAGCCTADFDCAVDELCDVGGNVCVPAGVVTTGPSDDSGGDTDGATAGELPTSGGADAGPGDGTDGATGSGGDTDSGGAADGDAAGCSCQSGDGCAPTWWLLAFGLGLAIRRRRRG